MKEAVVTEPAKSPAAQGPQQGTDLRDHLPAETGAAPFYQTKLTVGAPDDPLEKEADDTADRVMRMPEHAFIQRKCSHCEEKEKIHKKDISAAETKVQRQETAEETPQSPPPAPVPFHLMRPEELQLRPPSLPSISLYPGGVPLALPSSPVIPSTGTPTQQIDWFAMNRPFANRGAGQLSSSDATAIEAHWNYSFNFFRSIGATPGHAVFFSNMLVPIAIDSSLQRDYPTWWERTDRELGTSSKVFSPTLIRFDLNNLFGTIRPFWDSSNPYQIQRKEQKTSSAGYASASTSQAIAASKGSGEVMSNQTRSFMEARFGYDFSDVQIHHGAEAATMSADLHAKAFTVGKDIYFNQGKYAPDHGDGKQLLAHELTHTLQQGGSTLKKKNEAENVTLPQAQPTHSFIQCKLQPDLVSAELNLNNLGETTVQKKKLSQHPAGHSPTALAGPPDDPHNDTFNGKGKSVNPPVRNAGKAMQMIQRNILGDAWDATGGRAVSAIGSAASTVYDAAGNAISAAVEWVEDQAESIINRIAPGLIDFLRGDIIQMIKDALASAVDALTGGLFSRLQAEGLQGVLEEFVSSVVDTLTGAAEKGCNAFAALARKVLDFLRALGGSALQRMVSFFKRVGGLLSAFWNDFALPVWDAIKSFAGTVWTWITDTAAWLWDLIEPLRRAVSRAWNWLMRQFGIAWKAGGSVLDWLKAKALKAWNWLMSFIEPIKRPLMIIGGVLLMLSPMGPILAIGAGAYAIYKGVQWVRENWNSEVFVRFRHYLKEHIFDVIASAIESLKNSVVGAFSWLANTLLSLQAPVVRLLENIGAMALFRLIRGAIQSFANLITRAVNWAGARLTEIGHHIINLARDIWEFIRPYLIIAAKITFLILNPWLLPAVLAAWFWRILPDCFKPPIIDFVIEVMISVLRAMPNFKMFGDAWPAGKQKIIEQLQVALTSKEEEKIRMSNRIAQMVSELDLELISNQLEAVRQSPGYFDLELQSELLGINGTQSLPFERSALPILDENSNPKTVVRMKRWHP